MLSNFTRAGFSRLFTRRSAARSTVAVFATGALAVSGLVFAEAASAAPPTNDNFANATTISGATGTINGTTVESTGETGEPTISSSTPIRSIWYSWVAPSSASQIFDTCGSSFDTLLGIYTGTSVSTLTSRGTNDQASPACASGPDQSRVTFTPVAGTTYKIKIDGYFGDTGVSRLNWAPASVVTPPANDNFANAITLTGASGTASGTNVGATGETGEPINVSTGPIRSVWYRYTPASAGTLTVSLCTSPSSFDSTLGIYTGSAVNSLVKLASNDDGCGGSLSVITGQAVAAGTTYNISVDGYQGATSTFVLSYSFSPTVTPPANDNFANAIALSGATGSVTGTTVGATGETGEPRVVASTSPPKSVWYSWTAPTSGSATFSLCTGTTFDTVLGVYTGTAVNALTPVATNDDTTGCGSLGEQSRVTFAATAGTVYRIQVDGYPFSSGTVSGPFTLTYSIAVPLTLSVNDVTQNEGDTGTTSFDFTVSLSAAAVSTVTVNYATADQTATAPSDYATTTGSLTFTAGQVTKTVTVPVVGDTTFETTETFALNLSTAAGATIADGQGIGTITNDDGLPAVSIGDVTEVEGDSGTTTFTFPVTLSNPSAAPLSVDYATADDTATAGSDYAAETGSLVFAPGEVAKTVTVTVQGDADFEADETFFVNLSDVLGGTIADAQAVGTITNDDVATVVTLAIDDVSQAEGDAGVTLYTFSLTLSSASSSVVTVDFATTDGTAVAPSDYIEASGTRTFDPGDTSETVIVAVNGDTTYEPTEGFTVNLSNASGAAISDGTGLGIIVNDDTAPTLSIDDVTAAEGDSGTTSFEFTVTLDGATDLLTTVDFSTADGTANSPGDFGATSGTVYFAPGQTSATITTVLVTGDVTPEEDETFGVLLSNPVNATISDGIGVGTILNDDAATVDLQVGLSATASPVVVGDTITYNATVTNNGSLPATGVTLTDTLPVGPAYVSSSASQGSCSATATTVSCALGSLPPGATATVTIVVRPSRTGSYPNSVVVSSSQSDANPADNTASVVTTVIADGAGCTILGTPGNDDIQGTAGADTICGGDGNDKLRGLGGNDTIRGEGGTDGIDGGAGNDTIDGGAGSNIASYDVAPAGVVVSLATGSANDGQGGTDTLVGITTVRGSAFNDTLNGSAGADKLQGRNGNDAINGGGGNDTLDGGPGSDTLNGGAGTDRCLNAESRTQCEQTTLAGGVAAAAEPMGWTVPLTVATKAHGWLGGLFG